MNPTIYIEGSLLPDLHVWWIESDGETLADLSGYTFTAAVGEAGSGTPVAVASGFTAQAGSGDGHAVADIPNLVLSWPTSSIDTLSPGVYDVDIVAARISDDKVRKVRVRIEIIPKVGA